MKSPVLIHVYKVEIHTSPADPDERKFIPAITVTMADKPTDPVPSKATAFFERNLPKRLMIRKLISGNAGMSQIKFVIIYQFSATLSRSFFSASASNVLK